MSGKIFDDLLRAAGPERLVPPGSALFRIDDTVRSLFLVTTGEIHLVRRDTEGRTVVVQRAGASAILAEASVFSAQYHCDGIAVEPSAVRGIARSDFLALLDRNPDLARDFMAHLAHAVQAARARAEILFLKTVAERLDAWLALSPGGLPPKGTRRRVAEEIGVSPEALYRELARRRTLWT